MNAPASTAHLVEPQIELLPLAAIALSETAMQMKRRAAYDALALEELAKSIAETGLMHPIVVRPLEALRGLAKYELVAGERRFLATQKLGREHILARILSLTSEQVLRAQMVENIHRERLDVLAEAQGFRELLAQGVPADAIGDMIGKSRSYVYARTKLLDLAPGVQEALKNNEIDASQALLFARVPTHKLQEYALNQLRKWDYQGHGEKLSFRRTAEIFQEKGKGLLIPLAQVPFRLDDETYHTFGPKHGKNQAQEPIYLSSCVACPKRSGNDPELVAALEDPNVCTDKECHDVKAKQEFERRRRAAESSGREVLSGEAAAAIMPTDWGTRGYIDLDSPCEDDPFPEPEPKQRPDESDEAFDQRMNDWDERSYDYQPRTYRQILGEAVSKLEVKLTQDPKHKSRLRELAPDKAVVQMLKDLGFKAKVKRDTRKPEKPAKPEDPEAARRRTEREAEAEAKTQLEDHIAGETSKRLLNAMFEKYKGPTRDDLEMIAENMHRGMNTNDSMDTLYPKRVTFGAMSERDLARWLVCQVVTDALDDGFGNGDDRPLKALCKRLKVDPKAIEKKVREELTPRAETKPEKKKSGKSKRK